jgi:hypothetical protein
VKVVRNALAAATDYSTPIRQVTRLTHARFVFSVTRVLVGMELLPINSGVLTSQAPSLITLPSSIAEPVILSLPEASERRKEFVALTTVKTGPMFDSIRQLYHPTWMSCALSYSTIAKVALNAGLQRLSIAEDDVVFPPGFNCHMAIVEEYLQSLNGGWDLFSGIVADISPSAVVVSAEMYKGMQFIIIDKMTSTVFNVYNRRTLQLLADWDPSDGNVITNTIDRYIERQGSLRVVLTLPYLVQHRESTASTLWGFKNTMYSDMIMKSQVTLQRKLQQYMLERSNSSRECSA